MARLFKLLAIFAAFFVVAGLLIALGAVRSSSRSDAEAAIEEEVRDVPPAFNLTAKQLVKAYKEDEESAAAAYNDRIGIVEGPSFLVEESNYLRFYVDEVWAVRCFLSAEQMDRARALRSSRNRIPAGGVYGTFETRGIGSGWPIAFTSLPVFTLKGKVEGINNRHLTIDLRGCAVHDSP